MDEGKCNIDIKKKNVQKGDYCCVCGGWWWIFDKYKTMELLQVTDGKISYVFVAKGEQRESEGYQEAWLEHTRSIIYYRKNTPMKRSTQTNIPP